MNLFRISAVNLQTMHRIFLAFVIGSMLQFPVGMGVGVGVLPIKVANAAANSAVDVEVRGGADGEVTLSSRSGGGSFSCTTKAGKCRIASVPGGRYTVVFRSNNGKSTSPRTVMIAPPGPVKLKLSASK